MACVIRLFLCIFDVRQFSMLLVDDNVANTDVAVDPAG